MTVRAFYRLSLTLPILVPGTLMLAFYLTPAFAKWLMMSTSPMALGILLFSLLYGGIPYALLASWAGWRFTGQSESQIRKLVLTLPLLMALLVLIRSTVLAAANGALNRAGILLTAGPASSIVLGYAYVALAMGIRRFLPLTDE